MYFHILINIFEEGISSMEMKESFAQRLTHKAAQMIVHRELYGWPPDSPWGIYQPHRPEESLDDLQDEKETK